jgi:hypothetical protein
MELRLVLRSLLGRPALSTSVLSAVALAIAMNSALFSVLDGLLFRPLPFQTPDRLVAISYRQVGGQPPQLAYLTNLKQQRDAIREALDHSPLVRSAAQAGFSTSFSPTVARDFDLQVAGIDSLFFHLLGLSHVIGTGFSPDDENDPATLSPNSLSPLPIIIGHELWQRVYGADPGILGLREC